MHKHCHPHSRDAVDGSRRYLFKYIIIGDTGAHATRFSQSPYGPGLCMTHACLLAALCSLAANARLNVIPPPSFMPAALPLEHAPWPMQSFNLCAGVGKSCLLLQFTDKRFQPVHDLTIGVEFWGADDQHRWQADQTADLGHGTLCVRRLTAPLYDVSCLQLLSVCARAVQAGQESFQVNHTIILPRRSWRPAGV